MFESQARSWVSNARAWTPGGQERPGLRAVHPNRWWIGRVGWNATEVAESPRSLANSAVPDASRGSGSLTTRMRALVRVPSTQEE